MNCASCGAPAAWDGANAHWKCLYCGTIRPVDPDGEGLTWASGAAETATTTGRRCPVCRTAGLVAVGAANIPLEGCPRCRGVLVPVDGFLALLQFLDEKRRSPLPPAREPIRPAELDRRVECPGCGQLMDTHPYGGAGAIVLDNCPDCELNWLDHGELARASAAITLYPQPVPADEY